MYVCMHVSDDHQLYQKTVEAVCHPLSPTRRVLVDARMGAGKTKVLLQVLDQHFADPRKKVPSRRLHFCAFLLFVLYATLLRDVSYVSTLRTNYYPNSACTLRFSLRLYATVLACHFLGSGHHMCLQLGLLATFRRKQDMYLYYPEK